MLRWHAMLEECHVKGPSQGGLKERLKDGCLEKEMATHSSVLAWRIPGTGELGGLPSMGSHRVGHDWSDLAAAVVTIIVLKKNCRNNYCSQRAVPSPSSQAYLFTVFNIYWWPRILTLCGMPSTKLKKDSIMLLKGWLSSGKEKHYALSQPQLINLINNDNVQKEEKNGDLHYNSNIMASGKEASLRKQSLP